MAFIPHSAITFMMYSMLNRGENNSSGLLFPYMTMSSAWLVIPKYFRTHVNKSLRFLYTRVL